MVLPMSMFTALPIGAAALPFGAALGLIMVKALVAPVGNAVMVTPGLKADMVWPILLGLV